MPPQLVALSEGPNILLDKPILLLGRHQECDIQLASRKVSRRHCCIAQVSDYLVIRDLGSTNGIRINGVRVLEGRLTAGDEVTIGNHRYQVNWGEAEEDRPARRQVRETFRSRLPPGQVGDDLLEECDEPIPLAEPDGVPLRPVQGGPPAPADDDSDKDAPRSPSPVRNPDPEEPLILPDHLELMPPSDV